MSIELYGTVKTINSREVAEMLEKEHKEILRMIEGYEPPNGSKKRKIVGIIPTLTKGNVTPSEYFIKSSYKDNSGKENICYEVTKMGCEMLGNKLQGEKGILFTAKYVKRFNDMEEAIKNPIGLLESMQNKLKEQEERISKLESTNELIRKALNTGSKKEIKMLLPKNMGDIEKVQFLILENFDKYLIRKNKNESFLNRKSINEDCKKLFSLSHIEVKRILDAIDMVVNSSKVCNLNKKSVRVCVVNF